MIGCGSNPVSNDGGCGSNPVSNIGDEGCHVIDAIDPAILYVNTWIGGVNDNYPIRYWGEYTITDDCRVIFEAYVSGAIKVESLDFPFIVTLQCNGYDWGVVSIMIDGMTHTGPAIYF